MRQAGGNNRATRVFELSGGRAQQHSAQASRDLRSVFTNGFHQISNFENMNMTKQLSESLLAACKAAGIENPRYIAQNANGKVIHHDNQPSRKGWDSIWGGGGIPKRLNHPPYADNWQDSLLEWVDHIADTSKKFDMQDAIADAYRKHVGRCGLQTYAQTYRHGWQDALAWKGGSDD